jgi:hypothetical protein
MWKSEGHGLELNYKIQNLTNVKQGFLFVDFNLLILKMNFFPKNRKIIQFTLEKISENFSPKTLLEKCQNLSEVVTGKGVQSLPTQLVFPVMQLSTRKPSAL